MTLNAAAQKIDLVILAAGKSSRFGSLKGFAKYKDAPLLESAIKLHQDNFEGQTIVVISDDSIEYKNQLESKFPKATFVLNPHPENGPFSSLQIGLTQCDSQHVFILPVDCPCRDLTTWESLNSEIKDKIHVLKPSFKKKGGHPIIISKYLKKLILEKSPCEQLNLILRSIPFEQIKYIESTNDDCIKNINTIEDLC